MSGIVNGGKPWGSSPTSDDALAAEIEHDDGDDARDDGDQHAGDPRRRPPRHEDDGQTHDTDGQRLRDRLTVGEPAHEAAQLLEERVGVDGEPEELGELAHQDGEGQPVHVADLGGLGEQVGDEAQPADPGEDHARPHQQGEHGRQGDGLRRVAVGADERAGSSPRSSGRGTSPDRGRGSSTDRTAA